MLLSPSAILHASAPHYTIPVQMQWKYPSIASLLSPRIAIPRTPLAPPLGFHDPAANLPIVGRHQCIDDTHASWQGAASSSTMPITAARQDAESPIPVARAAATVRHGPMQAFSRAGFACGEQFPQLRVRANQENLYLRGKVTSMQMPRS